jgi:hypothetical protein
LTLTRSSFGRAAKRKIKNMVAFGIRKGVGGHGMDDTHFFLYMLSLVPVQDNAISLDDTYRSIRLGNGTRRLQSNSQGSR